MTNVLVELIELNNESQSNYIIHVDSSFKPEDLQKYINHIKNNSELYTFYINKEVFKLSLESVMERYKINSETKIVIEFEVEKNKFDEELDLKHQISFIKTDVLRKCVYIGFYKSVLKCLELDSGKIIDVGNEECFINVRMMCFNELHQMGFVKNLGLVNFNTSNVISDKLEISSLFVYENKVLYGTQDGKCFVYENDDHKLLGEIEGYEIISIYEQNKILFFCARNGNILKLIDDFIDNEKKDFLITCSETYKDSVFYGTSSNVLYKQTDNNIVNYNIEIRFIDWIRILNDNTVIIGGQYIVQIIILDPYKLIYEFKFDSEVSGIEIVDNILLISSGTKLYKKKLNLII